MNLIKFAIIIIFLRLKLIQCSNISSHENRIFESRKRPALHFLIKPCPGFESDLEFVRIPVLHPQFEYYEENLILDKNNALKKCPFGGELGSVATTAAIDEIPKNATKRSGLLRSVSVLLDNGYLSVGENRTKLTYYSQREYCLDSISDGKATFKTCSVTKSRPIFKKCCPFGLVLGERGCVLSPNNLEFNLKLLDANDLKRVTVFNANGVFTANRFSCQDQDLFELSKDGCDFDIYTTTNNRIVTLGRNRKWEYQNDSTSLCFETKWDGTEIALTCGYKNLSEKVAPGKSYRYVYMVSQFISAFFHLLTSLVYLITWKRQNVHRRVLCLCSISLCFSTALIATIYVFDVLQIPKTASCISVGVAVQYFMIASFTWLLIINVDLYRTFRTLKLPDPTKNCGTLIAYNVFGWGFPLAISLISLGFEFGFKCATSEIPVPGFGIENCFISGYSQGYFLYFILAVLIGASFLVAVVTLVNIGKFKTQGAALQSSKKQSDKQTVLLYLRLSVLMGITWIFEVISWTFIESNIIPYIVWVILDVYNFISAILIFAFFVCNKQTLDLMRKTHPVFSTVFESLSFSMSMSAFRVFEFLPSE